MNKLSDRINASQHDQLKVVLDGVFADLGFTFVLKFS